MKKSITTLFCLLIAFSFCSQAQTEKGNVILGGDAGFRMHERKTETKRGGNLNNWSSEDKSLQINAFLRTGYFVQDNFSTGLRFNYNYRQNTDPKNSEYDDTIKAVSSSNTFRVGPFARYYIALNDDLALFGQIDAYYGIGRENQKINGEEQYTKSSVTEIGGNMTPGLTWFLNERIGINFSLSNIVSYNYEESEFETKDPYLTRRGEEMPKRNQTFTDSRLNANLSLSSLSLGVNVFL